MIKLENEISGIKKEYRLNCFVKLCWYAAKDLRKRLDGELVLIFIKKTYF